MKTEVYSWRLSPDLKAALEREARIRKAPISTILEMAVRQWLQQCSGHPEDDEAVQRALHAAVAPYLGVLEGDDPRRSEKVSEIVRERIRRQHGR
jgi:predicted transcriptional regulator